MPSYLKRSNGRYKFATRDFKTILNERRGHILEMTANKFYSSLLLLLATTLCIQTATGFWFTENSFTYQPAQVAQVVKDSPAIGATSSEEKQQTSSNSVTATGSLEVLTKTEPWIRLGQSNEQQQQQCQCNLDWLQNQTSLWVGKWLDKAQAQVVASVASGAPRALSGALSSSTGATSIINRRQHAPPSDGGQTNNNNVRVGAGNHWSSWISRSGSGVQQRSVGAKSNGNNGSNKQHQLQLKLAQGPRGPPGPKGEQGPRGEPGPPGAPQQQQHPAALLRVQDQDALFDLPSNSSSPASLVFVEAEQMLVVATQSGWRPLQLAGPLRNFRRAIAKFSLPAAAGRRRLTGGAGDDNLIAAGRRPAHLVSDVDEDDEDVGLEDEEEDEEEEEEEEADEEELDEGDEEDNELRDKSSASALVAASMSAPVLVRPLPLLLSSSTQPPPPVAAPLVAATTTEPTSARLLKLRVAALNEPYSGNVHGIRGADFECKRQASKANIKGSFRAMLSSSFQNLNEIVRHNVHKYPVVNLRDEILANSWYELLRQPLRVSNPLSRIYSFSGRHVATHSNWPNKLVWHGVSNRLGQQDQAHNCDGWHSDSLSKFGWATPLHAPRNSKRKNQKKKRFAMTQSMAFGVDANNSTAPGSDYPASHSLLEIIDKYPCRMPLIVLCIETVGQVSGSAAQLVLGSNQIN